MENVAGKSAERNPYPCRKCGGQIFWHKAASGKHYPCDSATNRKAFHQCKAAQQAKPAAKAQPAQTPKAITPDYFEATLDQRVEHLEKQLTALVRTVQEVQHRQAITAEDVGL